MVSQRWASTVWATPVQNRFRPSGRLRRGQRSRDPRALRITGTSVSVVATLNSGISRPPRPMLRRNGNGTSTSAASDTATVTPLNSTLRPAVPIARWTDSSSLAPAARSSRHLVTRSRE